MSGLGRWQPVKILRHGQLAGLASALLFGRSAPLISTLTGAGSALSLAGLLYGGSTVALLAMRLVRGTRAETPVSRRGLPALAALTLLGGVVGPVALVLGLARLSAAAGSLLLNLEAVFTLAIAVLLGREHLGRRELLSAGLTIAGAVLLSEGSLAGASWIGGLGYGLSIWLDLLALRDLGAAREAVLFATAPFVGALFSLLVLREAATPSLLAAAALMAAGVVLLLRERHSHWHRHELLDHAHRHHHDPRASDPHHEHRHDPRDLEGIDADQPIPM